MNITSGLAAITFLAFAMNGPAIAKEETSPSDARGFGSKGENTLPWHTDADAAFAEAKETGRPVLLVFR